MLGHRKGSQTTVVTAPLDGVPAGKGRPTPKRREAEAANRHPLVPDDRRGAAKSGRQAQREQRQREYAAMQSGDERFLPTKDKGPVRRYIRDSVDARWSLGEFFLPAALIFLVAEMALYRPAPVVAAIAMLALYVYILAMLVDTLVFWRRLRKRLLARFGPDALVRGTAFYAALRVFQLRPTRLPRPQVKRGELPA